VAFDDRRGATGRAHCVAKCPSDWVRIAISRHNPSAEPVEARRCRTHSPFDEAQG